VIETIRSFGHSVIDLGADSAEPVDYPDFTVKAGRLIASGKADRAVVVCGSGVGACIVGNKIRGVYACLCHDVYSAAQGVEHDRMNMLCLGARVIEPELAKRIIQAFLEAVPSDDPRHLRRVGKIRMIEDNELKGSI
jgi:ribose 5-phosphate isomerase B